MIRNNKASQQTEGEISSSDLIATRIAELAD
jgi:hypothetical protein